MIDLLTENRAYTKEELKARAMSRLSERGLGLAERLANVERIVYSLLDPAGHAIADKAQVAAIGAALATAESGYNTEVSDNAKLATVLEYEAAVTRLAEPVESSTDKDADGNLLYPDVPELDPTTGKPTGKMLLNPAIVTDKAERKAATAVKTAATAATVKLAADRDASRKAAQATV